ncbi:DUF4352 domain-containing protein [Candidatus Saccharibacteria bacterium]|nr:DUF4352 domain-containing protein [Candidatus Saccharibacteria bacterium]
MDNFGGVTPNPNEAPRLDTQGMPQQPQSQPQFVDPMQAQPQSPPIQGAESYGSVPMTDPNAPMAPPQMQQPMDPQTQQVDAMLSPPPAPIDTSSSSSSKSKMIIFAAIGVVLILAAGAGGYFIGYSSGKTAGKQAADAAYQEELAKQQAAADEDVSSEPEELDLSELIDPDYSADESLEGQVGETITSADGFVLRVNNIERNYTTDNPDYVVDETKELVKINFQMGNATKAKTMDISSQTSFKLVDSTGSEVLPANISEYDGKFDVTKLDPGTQSTASIIFEVNKDDVPLQFSRKQPYRITNQNREVTFVTLVTVAE